MKLLLPLAFWALLAGLSFSAADGIASTCQATGPAVKGAELKVDGVTAYEEFSDQQNQIGSRVFVLHFNREVRNRSGYLVVDANSRVRLPILSTVSEDGTQVPSYDHPTRQLEIREWEIHWIDGVGESAEERTAFFNRLVGQPVGLELEICRGEFRPIISELKDAKYLNPDYQRPGHPPFEQLVLSLNEAIPYRTNGDFRATIKIGDETRYVWFFVYPNSKAPLSNLYLANRLYKLDLSPEKLGAALVGRTAGIKSSGGVPWQSLPSPFPEN